MSLQLSTASDIMCGRTFVPLNFGQPSCMNTLPGPLCRLGPLSTHKQQGYQTAGARVSNTLSLFPSPTCCYSFLGMHQTMPVFMVGKRRVFGGNKLLASQCQVFHSLGRAYCGTVPVL